MRNDFQKLSQELMKRPINDGDLEKIREHAQGVRKGVSVGFDYKDKQGQIIDRTVRDVYAKYPQKEKEYRECREKTARDMHLVGGYNVYSALLDDPDYQKNKMLIWFRTVLKNYKFGDDFIADAYRMMGANVEKFMKPETAAQQQKLIDDAIEVFVS